MRFGVNNSLSFPPSQIHAVNWEDEIPLMTVNFMGLTGPMGVLPYVYSELIAARARNRDRSMAAFFDIFNHRIISLFYRAWEKYRSPVAYERDGEDRLLAILDGGDRYRNSRAAEPDADSGRIADLLCGPS